MSRDVWELLSYVVTVIGLPLAISVFLFEQRKERENEEDAVYQQLSDNYPARAGYDIRCFPSWSTTRSKSSPLLC